MPLNADHEYLLSISEIVQRLERRGSFDRNLRFVSGLKAGNWVLDGIWRRERRSRSKLRINTIVDLYSKDETRLKCMTAAYNYLCLRWRACKAYGIALTMTNHVPKTVRLNFSSFRACFGFTLGIIARLLAETPCQELEESLAFCDTKIEAKIAKTDL